MSFAAGIIASLWERKRMMRFYQMEKAVKVRKKGVKVERKGGWYSRVLVGENITNFDRRDSRISGHHTTRGIQCFLGYLTI